VKSFARVFAVLLVLALAVTGCAQPKAEPKKTESVPPKEKLMIVAFPADPPSLNPITESGDYAQAVCINIFNKLVKFDKDFNIKPDLAKTWEIKDGGKTFVFNLDTSFKWHDGKPVTSADVKWSLDTAKAVGATKSRLQDVAGIETPDEKTVIIKLNNPSGVFLSVLAWGSVQIMPKHLYEGTNMTENPYNRKPIGSGPFKFQEWKAGEYITLVANKDYPKGKPDLDKVVIKFIPQAQSAIAALKAGEIQVLSQYSAPPFRDMATFEKDPNFTVVKWNHYTFWRLIFNMKEKPFNDVRVRQAFAYALDREKIVQACYAGIPMAAKTAGPLSPSVAWAYNKDATNYPYDPAKAEALLQQAGLKKDAAGIRLKCTLDFVDYLPGDKDMWLMARDMFAKVGIQVELKQYDATAWNDKVYNQKKFQVSWAGSGGPDPDILRYMFETGGSGNPGSYSNTTVDKLLNQGAQLMTVEERKPIYYQIEDLIAKDACSIPIWNLTMGEVWDKNYQGREAYSMYFADFSNIKYVGK